MIYSLLGKIAEKTLDRVVVVCGGIGYEVHVPASVSAVLPPVGAEAQLYTYMNITENDISLFGFADVESRRTFLMLTGVSGVGPKAGLAILSVLTPDRIALAISAGDHKAFTAASGVGPKLAQRIVLELKDKVGKGLAEGGITLSEVAGAAAASPQGTAAAIAALTSLGYSQSEAALAIAKLDASLPVEELVRGALQAMAGRLK